MKCSSFHFENFLLIIFRYLLRKLQGFQALKDGSAQTNPMPGLSSSSGKNVTGDNSESQGKKKAQVKKRPATKTVGMISQTHFPNFSFILKISKLFIISPHLFKFF